MYSAYNVDQSFSETFLNACGQYPELLRVRSVGEQDSESGDSISRSTDLSEIRSIASDTTLGDYSLTSFETAPSSISSTESSIGNVTSDLSRRGQSSPESSLIRESCRFDCYCSCHPRVEKTSGGMRTLSKSFSRLTFSKSQCNDPNCRGNIPSEGSEQSANFFRKTFLHVTAAHSIKTRHNLKTFRPISEGQDVIRYIKQGDFDSLKAAIETGSATIWDTTPDGWSLLHVCISIIFLQKNFRSSCLARLLYTIDNCQR